LGGIGPGRATDGNLGNFTHTRNGDLEPTWEVDLGDTFSLTRIVLHNRRGCCPSRLRDITVSVLDEAGDTQYASALLNPGNALRGPPSLEVDLLDVMGGVRGRHVRIQRTPDGEGNLDERRVLSLAEVEVFGGDASVVLECSRCEADAECGGADLCTGDGRCGACNPDNNEGCDLDGDTPSCDRTVLTCRRCTGDEDCVSNNCDQAAGQCRN
jgi:hypothetical protein